MVWRLLTITSPRLERLQQILLATMPDVRPLASILKSLSFRHQATLKIDSKGLRFTVEEGRGLQAHAYINSTSFSSYNFSLSPSDPAAVTDEAGPSPPASPSSSPAPEDPPATIYCHTSISLSTMLECLNIFGNAGATGALGGGGGGGSRDRARRESTFIDGDDESGYGYGGRRRQGRNREEDAEMEVVHNKEKTSVRISYKALGEPLVLLLEESGIVTRCELTTYEPDGLLDLAFPDDERVVRLIIKSEWLRDALLELPSSSEKLSISFAPPHLVSRGRRRARGHGHEDDRRDEQNQTFGMQDDEEEEVPLFRLESAGIMGSTEMDYSDDRDVLEVFECEQPTRNSYKFSHIQLTKQALNASIKTSIRTAPSGLVSFQLMIPLGRAGGRGSGVVQEDKVGFVEFLCIALDEDY
ncbi:hypothetical protein JCM11251_003515 [Rhodosporidiobolus azoricus]